MQAPSDVFRSRLGSIVARPRWRVTERELARRLDEELGYRLPNSRINEIKRGTRRVLLDDAFAIAAALDVSPINMMIGKDGVNVGSLSLRAEKARRWFRGQSPLRPGSGYYFEEPAARKVTTYKIEQAVIDLVAAWPDDLGAADVALDELEQATKKLRVAVERARTG